MLREVCDELLVVGNKRVKRFNGDMREYTKKVCLFAQCRILSEHCPDRSLLFHSPRRTRRVLVARTSIRDRLGQRIRMKNLRSLQSGIRRSYSGKSFAVAFNILYTKLCYRVSICNRFSQRRCIDDLSSRIN